MKHLEELIRGQKVAQAASASPSTMALTDWCCDTNDQERIAATLLSLLKSFSSSSGLQVFDDQEILLNLHKTLTLLMSIAQVPPFNIAYGTLLVVVASYGGSHEFGRDLEV